MTIFKNKIGSFITGSFAKLSLRQKSDQEFELGQLLVAGKNENDYSIYQIKDLFFGSQIPEASLELMAGYGLERPSTNLKIYEPELRNYVLASAKPLINIKQNDEGKKDLLIPKKLPQFFSEIYEIDEDHLEFFKDDTIKNPMTLGKIRSGSKVMKTEVKINAKKVLKHHVLIPATTGRGKSNLVKDILFNLMDNDKIGKLVFDPHNEYYGSTTKKGLRDHPKDDELLDYYTVRTLPGSKDLKFNVSLLNPYHVMGSIDLSPAQRDAIILYYRQYKKDWISAIFRDNPPEGVMPGTANVLKRKLAILLRIETEGEGKDTKIIESGIYTLDAHASILNDIKDSLLKGKTVIVDTSLFSGNEEIFVATIIVNNMLNEYKRLKYKDKLKGKPIITIVLEEAPRVIGRKVLEARENIFGTIAKEGRKFKIGLIAITQLPSVIPREILANMNTKIILGNEMGPERTALIQSSAQDLSDDSQTIASLDIGEAIVTSNFTKFAIPIKIQKFEDLIEQFKKKAKPKPKKGSPGF